MSTEVDPSSGNGLLSFGDRDRQQEQQCRYFLKGEGCRFGSRCRFLHAREFFLSIFKLIFSSLPLQKQQKKLIAKFNFFFFVFDLFSQSLLRQRVVVRSEPLRRHQVRRVVPSIRTSGFRRPSLYQNRQRPSKRPPLRASSSRIS